MNDDCEIASFYATFDRVARKRHECCECDAPILSGETYLRINAKWGTVIESFAQHLVCAEACMYVRDNIADDCLSFGGLKDFLGEDYDWKNKGSHPHFRDLIAKIWWRERKP